MNILGLDLGTKTGWCVETGSGLFVGTEVLASPKMVTYSRKIRFDRRLDPRIPKLKSFVNSKVITHGIDLIVFEDVQFGSTTFQTQLWASFRTVVWLVAHETGIMIECVPTGTLKKFATGNGAATKEDMMKAVASWSSFRFQYRHTSASVLDTNTEERLDDNACDALHLCRWARQHIRL